MLCFAVLEFASLLLQMPVVAFAYTVDIGLVAIGTFVGYEAALVVVSMTFAYRLGIPYSCRFFLGYTCNRGIS